MGRDQSSHRCRDRRSKAVTSFGWSLEPFLMIGVASRLELGTFRQTSRACPVCGLHGANRVHTAPYALFDDSALPTTTVIVQCRACGMTYADSTATAAAYRTHYADHSKYASAEAASGSGRTAADGARLTAAVDRIAPALSPDASILDIGAGQGGLLHAFLDRGFTDVTGVDPSSDCVTSMRRDGLTAKVGELEALSWPTDPRRFDLITLSHVCEHVFDVRSVFRQVEARVADGGRIYIEVPDASRYTLDGFPPFYFFDPEHINHFDLAALDTLACKNGWRIERSWIDVIVLASGVRYPIVAVLLTRADRPRKSASRGAVGSPLGDYIASSQEAVQRSPVHPSIDRWLNTGQKIVLWGAGSHAQRLLAQTRLGECAVECIIDGDVGKQGRSIMGLSVVDQKNGLARARKIDAEIAVAIAVGGDEIVVRLATDHPDLVVHVLR